MAIILVALLPLEIGAGPEAFAADGDEAGENDDGDVGDWILRLFRGIGEDGRMPESPGEGGAGTGGSSTGGSVGGDDDDGNDDEGGDDDGGGGDDGGDDGGSDDGGDDD